MCIGGILGMSEQEGLTKEPDLVQFTGAPVLKHTGKGVNMDSVSSIFDDFIN